MSRLRFLGTVWPSQCRRTPKCHAAMWTGIWPFKFVTPAEKASVLSQISSELYHSRCTLKGKPVAIQANSNFSEIMALHDTTAWEKSFSVKTTQISTCFWSSRGRNDSIGSKFCSNMYPYYIYPYAKYKAVWVKSRFKIWVCPKEPQCPKDHQYTV